MTMTTGTGGGLTIENVHAAYGRIEVLHGVDLTVPGGTIFALLGPNGAGKSTLLKLVGGRLHPTAGTVAIDGLLARRWTPRSWRAPASSQSPRGAACSPI